MRIMGFDIGTKRIGSAMSDELGIVAQALGTPNRTTTEKDVERLLTIANQQWVEKMVVGLPKNMDGTLGKSAQRVLTFVENIQEAGRYHSIFETSGYNQWRYNAPY